MAKKNEARATGGTIDVEGVSLTGYEVDSKFTVPTDASKVKPEYHDKLGTSYNITVPYGEAADDAQAVQVITAKGKGWGVVDLVNARLKSEARGNRYSAESAKYAASTLTPDDIKAKMFKELLALGKTEEEARAIVASL